jgi:predicted acylesterase/phospholipase RssA
MPREREKTAFVLAGGGAKGAFEAGAIAYLVEEESVAPAVITATSAGSICGAVLAQARGHGEFLVRSRELRDDLLAMTHTDLLFGKQPWYRSLDDTPIGRAIHRNVIERSSPAPPEDVDTLYSAAVGGRSPGRGGRALAAAGASARALSHLVRSRRTLRAGTGSFLTLDPMAAALRGQGGEGFHPIDPAMIARPGLELRMAVVALGAGVLRYVTGDGTIVASDAVTPVEGDGAGPVDVLEGMLASASVPMIFPPRRLADDVYADGGVANNVPVDAAAALGATRIFAILAVPLAQPPDQRDYARASGPLVFLRATGMIAFAERQRANLNPPLPAGTSVTVIDPILDVVGAFEVSQGLMLLDMDYGWMRAADILAEIDDATRRAAMAATDAVVAGRVRAWHREEAMWRAGRAGRSDVRALAEVKRAVADAVATRKGLGLPTPPDADRWSAGYEAHRGPAPAGLPADAGAPG